MPTFLIIDDSPTIRRMIMSALRPLNGSYSEASTGLEAIEKLALRKHDAATLDLNMPDMHGLELLQFLRTNSTFKDIPIMVVTTRGDEGMLVKAMEAGANAYIIKPFKPDEILGGMKRLLGEGTA
jgi:two-component system, chemotaxis family, chemotaxis protein CheY